MKLFIKLMLFVVVTAVASLFLIKGPDGRAVMSWDRLQVPEMSLPDLAKAADKIKEGLDATKEGSAGPIEVYKWQDEKGIWHYSDNDEQQRSAQKLTVDPNANLTHYEPVRPPEHKLQTADVRKKRDASSPDFMPTSAPLGKLSTLIDDAGNVDKLQKERFDRQERAMRD